MSPAHLQAVSCDAPGCLAEIEYTSLASEPEDQAHVMRLVAIKAGWRLGHGDYCPNHTDEAPCADITECHPVLRDVLAERRLQDAAWAEHDRGDTDGRSTEVAIARYATGVAASSGIFILNEAEAEGMVESDPETFREGLIMIAAVAAVAAVAVAWAEAIDRHGPRGKARQAS